MKFWIMEEMTEDDTFNKLKRPCFEDAWKVWDELRDLPILSQYEGIPYLTDMPEFVAAFKARTGWTTEEFLAEHKVWAAR